MQRTVYIISGPAGVGKSTTSAKLVQSLERSAYISGDDISHIPVKGRQKPWLSDETNRLTWTNIVSLTKNLIEFQFDVVIDYVTFPQEMEYVRAELRDCDVRMIYVVLMAQLEAVVERDQSRPEEIRMGERSVILHREFEEALQDRTHVLDTTGYTADDLCEIVERITTDARFQVSAFEESGSSDGEKS